MRTGGTRHGMCHVSRNGTRGVGVWGRLPGGTHRTRVLVKHALGLGSLAARLLRARDGKRRARGHEGPHGTAGNKGNGSAGHGELVACERQGRGGHGTCPCSRTSQTSIDGRISLPARHEMPPLKGDEHAASLATTGVRAQGSQPIGQRWSGFSLRVPSLEHI